VALGLAKSAGRKPMDIAEALRAHLPLGDLLASVEVAPPGFLNLRLHPAWLRAQIEAIIAQGAAYFDQPALGAGRTALIEFVSANPTGPLHIGRTRGAIIGSTLVNILRACGWQVESEYYFNNAGRQMELLGKSLQARYLQALGQKAALPDEGYKGEYLINIAQDLLAEHGDSWREEDWPAFKAYAEAGIFKLIKATLARVGIQHDHFFNEQTTYDTGAVWQVLQQLRDLGYVYEAIQREGEDEDSAPTDKNNKPLVDPKPAQWFRSTAFGDNQDRVLVKSNGDPTYTLPDIAYHLDKIRRGYARSINILGADHIIEAQTVLRALQALGQETAHLEVVLHQFVTFGEARMSTRAGNYVTLDDLIDEVGADVVRYFMLGRSHNSHIEFDFELAKQNSRENPVYYIQNAHVRCAGILRQAIERALPDDWDAEADLSLLGAAELEFTRKVLELPEILVKAHDELAPHQVAFYTLELARLFHPLYDEVRVFHSDVPEATAKARLRFYRMAKITFAYLLGLLGMSAPERM
jgi:arginyl-tRNA synthetase